MHNAFKIQNSVYMDSHNGIFVYMRYSNTVNVPVTKEKRCKMQSFTYWKKPGTCPTHKIRLLQSITGKEEYFCSECLHDWTEARDKEVMENKAKRW